MDVTAARGTASGLVVDYVETQPGPSCVVTSAISLVWTAVAVPARFASVSGNRTVTVRNCR